MRGGMSAPEYRRPWVLRALCAQTAEDAKYQNGDRAILPPLVGPRLLALARSRFDFTNPPFSLLRDVGLAFLTDARANASSPELTLMRREVFAVLKTTLRQFVAEADIERLITSGLLREARVGDKENAYVARVPELLAGEVARLLAEELTAIDRADPLAGASLLIHLAGGMPLGDIVAAQAILHTAGKAKGINRAVIDELFRRKPWQRRLEGRINFLMKIPDGPFVDVTANQNAMAGDDCSKDSSTDQLAVIEDFEPWLVLSHVVTQPFEVLESNSRGGQRGDYHLLLELLTCPIPMTSSDTDWSVGGVHSHDLPDGTEIACNHDGIVEPMTWALLTLLSHEQVDLLEWLIHKALETPNVARLSRFDAALGFVSDLQNPDPGRSAWAAAIRHEKIAPALSEALDAVNRQVYSEGSLPPHTIS
jgi:hypothetical protein